MSVVVTFAGHCRSAWLVGPSIFVTPDGLSFSWWSTVETPMVKIRAFQDFKHPAAEPEDPGPRDEQVTPGLTPDMLPDEQRIHESEPSGRFDVRWYRTEVIDHAQA